MVEKNLDLDLRDCLELAAPNTRRTSSARAAPEQVLEYMIERFRAWYEEEAFPPRSFKAVSAQQALAPLDIHRRVQAVHAFRPAGGQASLAAANKRVSNILGKLDSAHPFGGCESLDLLLEPQEQELAATLAALTQVARGHLENDEYTAALACLAGLKEPVDAFFDGVMVNAEDASLRHNRLNLLKVLRELFLEVADISQLVVAR